MKKLIAVLLTSILCMTALTACGNDAAGNDSGTTSETAGTEDSSESDEAGTAAADGSAEPAEDGQTILTVGTNAEFPPFEYVGDDGEPEGFDIALIKAIGEKLGMEVQIENMEFVSLVTAIGSKIDIAIAGMTITEERLVTVDFSDPYYEAVQYVIVREGTEIATAADLEGKTIGTQLGTTGSFIVEYDIPNAISQEYNKAVDAVNDLINGRLDLVIIDRNPAMVFVEKFSGQVVALEGAQFGFETEDYAIALPKGETELADKINQVLAEIKADGTFDELVAQYIKETE